MVTSTSSFYIGSDVWSPVAVQGYSSARTSRNVLHPILSSSEDAVTYRPLSLRRGTFSTVWASLAEAHEFEAALFDARKVLFSNASEGSAGLVLVLSGSVNVELDPDTNVFATVDFEWSEVS